MTLRHTIAAATLSVVALMSGAGSAADFTSQLSEAKVASQTAGRETRAAVTPALNAARSLSAGGAQDEAQDFLDFARGKLGLAGDQLATGKAIMAAPVIAVPAGPARADGGGIVGLRDERS